jgi:Big-like domain-containing protein
MLTTLSVTLAAPSIEIGQFTSAVAVAFDQNGQPIAAGEVTYESSAPEVAAISPTTGAILGLSSGVTVITATAGARSAQRIVTVSKAPVRIKEIRSRGDAPGTMVELVNPTDEPVDMAAWTLIATNVSRSVTLPVGTTIPPHGVLLVDETKFPEGLSAVDEVHLFSKFGVEVDVHEGVAHACNE